jgi:hypothetical protein
VFSTLRQPGGPPPLPKFSRFCSISEEKIAQIVGSVENFQISLNALKIVDLYPPFQFVSFASNSFSASTSEMHRKIVHNLRHVQGKIYKVCFILPFFELHFTPTELMKRL